MKRQRVTVSVLLLFGVVALVIYVSERHNERNILNQYGKPLLAGPLAPGGPTYGESKKADLEVTAFSYYQRKNGQQAPFAVVKNKSHRIWHDISVEIKLYHTNYTTSKGVIPIGTLNPGMSHTGVSVPVGVDVARCTVEGIQAR